MGTTEKIILGTAQFGLDYGVNNAAGQPGEETVFDILNEAHRGGVRLLDTAEAYGNAHERIGRYHAQYPDRTFRVITKLPHEVDGQIGHRVNTYLQQLQVQNLEALMFHSFHAYQTHAHDLTALEDLKQKGKIRQVGVSVYTNAEMETVLNDGRVDLIQLPFNLLDNTRQRGELLRKAKQNGKTVHVRSVFLQGLFFKQPDDPHPVAQALKNELAHIRELARKHALSLQSLALNYALSQSGVDHVLIGVDSKEQLLANLAIAHEQPDPEIIREIDAIQIADTDLLNPSLWNR